MGGPAVVVPSPRVDNSISVQRFDVSHGTPVLVSRAAAAGSCPPTAPLATLATRSALAIPTCPRGQVGQGTMLQPVCRSTDDPTAPVGAREAPRPPGHRPPHN